MTHKASSLNASNALANHSLRQVALVSLLAVVGTVVAGLFATNPGVSLALLAGGVAGFLGRPVLGAVRRRNWKRPGPSRAVVTK